MKVLQLILYPFKKWKENRDKKFIERIDKLYFQKDKYGNRFIKGQLHAVFDEETKAKGSVTAWLDIPSDKVVPKLLEFEHAVDLR